MQDIAAAYNRYQFLGHEFLTWLWYVMEMDQEKIQSIDKQSLSLETGNRIVLEKNQNDISETITIKGDDAGLEEGILALKKGAVVTEINLKLKLEEKKWQFSIKGESLNISNLKVPETGRVESKEDLEGAILEKTYLYDTVFVIMDKLYTQFLKLRVSKEWNNRTLPMIQKWLTTQP